MLNRWGKRKSPAHSRSSTPRESTKRRGGGNAAAGAKGSGSGVGASGRREVGRRHSRAQGASRARGREAAYRKGGNTGAERREHLLSGAQPGWDYRGMPGTRRTKSSGIVQLGGTGSFCPWGQAAKASAPGGGRRPVLWGSGEARAPLRRCEQWRGHGRHQTGAPKLGRNQRRSHGRRARISHGARRH